MVRLKASRKVQGYSRISISIPYGAIKKLKDTGITEMLEAFQFLMVRLKGCPMRFLSSSQFYFNSLWFD